MSDENFKIENDKAADWALTKIHEAEIERDRLINLAEEQIDDLEARIREITDKCHNETAYLKSLLAEYFATVQHKETKTQESYKLLAGSLVFKKPSQKIVHDDEKLLAYLKGSACEEFIKVKESVDWAEFKKQLVIQDDVVVDKELGVVVDACTVEDVPASFDVKF